jgi:hypothetical protein
LAFGSRGIPRTAIATFAVVLSTLVLLTTTPWSAGSTKVHLAGASQAHGTTTTTTTAAAVTTSTTAQASTTTTRLSGTTTSTLARAGFSSTTTTLARLGISSTTTSPPAGGTSCADPSGQCLPATPAGYHSVCLEDFTVNAPTGSWGTTDASRVVYTGEHGCRWVEYPDGWSSTYTNGQPGYEPAQVLSVHDGMLDFALHNVNGLPAGANPSPILSNTGTQYQTYGMYEIRAKVVYNDANRLDDYHIAWLLWPQNDSNWQSAESDYPEADLSDNQVCAYAHYGGGGSQGAYCANVDFSQWHTYTQVWGPGYRSYYLDGQLVGTSTSQVWSGVERWQIQTEPTGKNDGSSGHVLVDWAAVYAPG